MGNCCSYNNNKQNGVIIFWIVLFLLVVGFRVALGPLGEVFCTSLLITITIHAFLWSADSCEHGLCCCCYDTDRFHPVPLSSSSSSHDDDVASESVHNTNDDNDDNEVTPISSSSSTTTFASRRENETTTTTTTTTTTRLPYLDNVKIFLTALVVTHHVSCAFGGCGEGSWYLIVGFDGPLWFEVFLNTLTLLDQSFFMPLFFFISAYFVPTSYAKRGRQGWKGLQASKRKRILIPAIFVTFFVSPAAIIVSNWMIQKYDDDNSTTKDSDDDTTAGKTFFYYYPSPGPAWFLYWLLLFNLVYVSVILASESDDDSSSEEEHVVTTTTRYALITNNNDDPEYTQPETLLEEEATIISSMSCPTTGRSDKDSPASNNMPEESCVEAQIPNPFPSIDNSSRDGHHLTLNASSGFTEEAITPGRNREEEEEENTSIIIPLKPFPSTSLRMCCGIFICGLLLIPFLIILDDPHTFASMPVSVGSLTCDFFMFYMGIEAKKNRWLENSLFEQLDIHPIFLTCIVILEGAALTILHLLMNQQQYYSAGIPLVLISGMFCLDVGLLILMVFQRWMNVETKFTRFLARGAFGVYLIHALVVTCISALYVHTYNNVRPDDPIDLTRGEGGGSYYPLGWLIVNLASHLVSWPLAYFLAQLPYLKTIL